MCRTDCAAAGVRCAAASSTTRQSFVRIGSLLKLHAGSGGFRHAGHRPFVQRLDLLPGGCYGTFLPAAVSADGGAPEIDSMIGLRERRQPIGRTAATAAAGKGAQTVRNLFPERAVRVLVLRAQL